MFTIEKTPISLTITAFANEINTPLDLCDFRELPKRYTEACRAWRAIYSLDEAYALTLLPQLEAYRIAGKQALCKIIDNAK